MGGVGGEGGAQGSLLAYLGMLLAASLFANTLPSILSSVLRGSFGWMLPLSSPGQLSGRSLTAGAHEGSCRSTAVAYRGEGTHSWGGSMEKGSLGPCQRPFPAPPPPSAMRGVTSAVTLWATSQFIYPSGSSFPNLQMGVVKPLIMREGVVRMTYSKRPST